jgi:hypothetical protein
MAVLAAMLAMPLTRLAHRKGRAARSVAPATIRTPY